MKIINFKPQNWYSCQYCDKDFDLEDSVVIVVGWSPLCSSRCIFMIYYNILKELPKNVIVEFSKALNIPKFDKLSDNTLLFEVSKRYPKPSLATINEGGFMFHFNNSCFKKGESVSCFTNSPPLYNKGVKHGTPQTRSET